MTHSSQVPHHIWLRIWTHCLCLLIIFLCGCQVVLLSKTQAHPPLTSGWMLSPLAWHRRWVSLSSLQLWTLPHQSILWAIHVHTSRPLLHRVPPPKILLPGSAAGTLPCYDTTLILMLLAPSWIPPVSAPAPLLTTQTPYLQLMSPVNLESPFPACSDTPAPGPLHSSSLAQQHLLFPVLPVLSFPSPLPRKLSLIQWHWKEQGLWNSSIVNT